MISLESLLERLEEARVSFGPGAAARMEKLLEECERREFSSADLLGRLHEAVLYTRAYPHSAAVRRLAERVLGSFERRVRRLRACGADLEALEEPEISGIAGTGVSAVLSYGTIRDLAARWGPAIDIEWDALERDAPLARALPRMLPGLAEEALVEPEVASREWVHAASGRQSTLAWLLTRLESVPFAEAVYLYDSMALMLRWDLRRSAASRTRTHLPVRRPYYHQGPLLRRRDVDPVAILKEPVPLPAPLSRREGERILRLARDTSAVRYRELHGFTFGDPARVRRAEVGRGVEIYVTGVPPAHRLPLRAYHAGMCFKNGIPIGYVEGLSLFERMEVGFNLYYTFRDGESAWLYAQIMRLFHHLAGITRFWVDPYQIGHENEEAIESGAFWFYRKMGFRPVDPACAALCAREEVRLARTAGARTTPTTLRRLARGAMVYESDPRCQGDWDQFRLRNVSLAIEREVAARFGGDRGRWRRHLLSRLGDLLSLEEADIRRAEGLAAAVALIHDLDRWPEPGRRSLAGIVQAKGGADETRCLRLSQQHPRFREFLLRLGSRG